MLILSLFLILVLAGVYFSNVILFPKTFGVQETYEIEVEGGKIDPEDFVRWPKEEVRLSSPHGYELFGIYVPAHQPTKRTVVFFHGITFSLYGMVKYATVFRDLGFNLLLVDHRNHGRSGGASTSFGFYEKDDARAWIDWVLDRHGPKAVVGTHGESFGAATALQHAAIDPRIAFCIADCSYANARDQFAYRLKQEYHLPAFPLIPISSLVTKVRAGFFYGDASPIVTIGEIEAPIFFIHGENDAYIPPEASIAMYEAKRKGARKLWLAPNADHAESYGKNRGAYAQEVRAFLDEVCKAYSKAS